MKMSPDRYEHLLSIVGPHLREPISPSERLTITLRYLASGESLLVSHFKSAVLPSVTFQLTRVKRYGTVYVILMFNLLVQRWIGSTSAMAF